jgi:hypothetical protein
MYAVTSTARPVHQRAVSVVPYSASHVIASSPATVTSAPPPCLFQRVMHPQLVVAHQFAASQLLAVYHTHTPYLIPLGFLPMMDVTVASAT